jgi:tRNA modification GTPase
VPAPSDGASASSADGRRHSSREPAEADSAGLPLPVSAVSGEGISELRALLQRRLSFGGAATAVQLTSDRHADALRRVAQSLDRAAAALAVSTLEVVAGEVGLAVEGLGEITGESASADLIDAIFRRFCIGK